MAKRTMPKDYEPVDRPLSKLNARRSFLSKIAEISPNKITELFDCCYVAFLRLTHYPADTYLADCERITHADFFPLEMLENYQLEVENSLSFDKNHPTDSETLNRLKDAEFFQARLMEWGKCCGIQEMWFLKHGWQVLLHYWKESKPKEKLSPVKGPMQGKPPILSRPMLPSSETLSLGLLKPPIAPVPVTLTKPIEARAKVTPAAGASRGFLKVTPIEPVKTQPLEWETLSLLTCGLVTKKLWEFWRDSFKAKFDKKRQRQSWRAVGWEIEREKEIRMIAPEHSLQNRYLRFGFFARSWIEKPESLRLKPPQPPEGLPSITDWPPGSQDVITRKQYEHRVKLSIQSDLERGAIKHVPKDVIEKWTARVFKECKPKINTYWQDYGKYLKSQGWLEVQPKTELSRDAELVVRVIVCRQRYEDIALERWKEKHKRTRKPTPNEWGTEIKGREEKTIRMAVMRMLELLELSKSSNTETS